MASPQKNHERKNHMSLILTPSPSKIIKITRDLFKGLLIILICAQNQKVLSFEEIDRENNEDSIETNQLEEGFTIRIEGKAYILINGIFEKIVLPEAQEAFESCEELNTQFECQTYK